MKKLINNRKLMQKLIISILTVLLLTFSVPIYSSADFGGLLIDPVVDLLGSVMDAIMGGLQMCLVDGHFGNGQGVGLNLSPFLAENDEFKYNGSSNSSNSNGEYDEFKFDPSKDKDLTEVIMYEDELDSHRFGGTAWYVPVSKYSPEKIFSGQIPALDVNFVNPKNFDEPDNPGAEIDYENLKEENKKSIAIALHQTIAQWYVALRNFVVVALMIILLYVGIRIVLSSTSSDKAKYKKMLGDWVIALCLVFSLHYIMSFTITIIDEVSTTLTGGNERRGNDIVVKVYPKRKDKDKDSTKQSELKTDSNNNNVNENIELASENFNASESEPEYAFKTDLMGVIRFKVQQKSFWQKVLYVVFYLAMTIMTVTFTIAYLKRVLTMAFLTIIAPVVALTYPIDKMNDGSAQAYNMWFKEYIFNALIQPFHLLLFKITIGSSLDLAVDNFLYAIVAMGFMTEAEKLLRKFFGFEKASTSGAMASFAGSFGGAAAFNMLKGAAGGKGGRKQPSGKSSDKIREANNPDMIKDENVAGKDASAFTGSGSGVRTDESQSGDKQEKQSKDEMNEKMERERLTREMVNPPPDITPEKMSENMARLNELNKKSQPPKKSQPTSSSSTAQNPPKDDDNPAEVKPSGVPTDGGKNNGFRARAGRFMTNTKRGLKNVVSKPAKNVKETFRRKLGTKDGRIQTIKQVANFAGRTAVRGVGAAAGLALGVGAGIAGGSMGDIAKYGIGGALLGNSTGGRAASALGRMNHNISNNFREGWYGDRNSAVMAAQKQQYMNDKAHRDYFKRELGVEGKELDEKMEEAAFWNNQGLKDDKEIKKTMSLAEYIEGRLDPNMSPEQKKDIARQQAGYTNRLVTSEGFNEKKFRTEEKYRDSIMNNFKDELKEQDKNMSQADIEKQSKYMLELTRKRLGMPPKV